MKINQQSKPPSDSNFRITAAFVSLSGQHFFSESELWWCHWYSCRSLTLQTGGVHQLPSSLCISMWVSSHKMNQRMKSHCFFIFCIILSFFIRRLKRRSCIFGGGAAFWGNMIILSTRIFITRTSHPPHVWVTGLGRKHISHILKTFQLTSTVDQCHRNETQACLVTVRSPSSPTKSHSRTAPAKTNRIRHIRGTSRLIVAHVWSANFLLDFVRLAATEVLVSTWLLSGKVAFPLLSKWKPRVPAHVLTRLRYTSTKHDPVGREREWGWKRAKRPWRKPAASLQNPPQKKGKKGGTAATHFTHATGRKRDYFTSTNFSYRDEKKRQFDNFLKFGL